MTCQCCGLQSVFHASRHGFEIFTCTSCGFGQTDVTHEDIRRFYDTDYFSGKTARLSQSETESADIPKTWWIDKYLRPTDINCRENGPGPAASTPCHPTRTRDQIQYEALEISDAAPWLAPYSYRAA